MYLTISLASFLIGVLTGSFQAPDPIGPSLLLGAAFLVISVLFHNRKARSLALCLGFLTAGHVYISAWRLLHQASLAGTNGTLTGIISEPPDVRATAIQLTVRVVDNGPPTKLLIRADRYPTWAYGDLVQWEGAVEAPKPFNSFNYPLYLERFGITGIVSRPEKLRLISHNRGSPVLAALYRLKDGVESRVQATIPEPEASLLAGILLGSKGSIPEQIQADLRQTGTSHIVAISGANITILLDILISVLPVYCARRQFHMVVGLSLFMTLLTGASASVMRGAFVACLGRFLRLRSRKAWATPFLLLSMTVLVLGNPLLLAADPGFQLSFAAFAGLLYLSGPINSFLDRYKPTKVWPEPIKSALAETTAATLGTAPLSLLLFHQLSLLGLIVNPLILWLLPAITVLGLIIAALGWIPAIMLAMRLPLWILLHAVLSVISSFGKVQFGVIHTS